MQFRKDARNGPLRGADYRFAAKSVNARPPLANTIGWRDGQECQLSIGCSQASSIHAVSAPAPLRLWIAIHCCRTTGDLERQKLKGDRSQKTKTPVPFIYHSGYQSRHQGHPRQLPTFSIAKRKPKYKYTRYPKRPPSLVRELRQR